MQPIAERLNAALKTELLPGSTCITHKDIAGDPVVRKGIYRLTGSFC
jgi:hypothetical protein